MTARSSLNLHTQDEKAKQGNDAVDQSAQADGETDRDQNRELNEDELDGVTGGTVKPKYIFP